LKKVPNWLHLSKRLRYYLISHILIDDIFATKWVEECGHWKLLIIKKKDAYKEEL